MKCPDLILVVLPPMVPEVTCGTGGERLKALRQKMLK